MSVSFPTKPHLGHSGMNLLLRGRCFLECEILARCHSWRWRWRSPQIAHGASCTRMPHTVEKPRLETAFCTISKLLFPIYLISILPQTLPHPGLPPDSSLPQDCALLLFPPPLCTCLSLSPGSLLHPQNPPKATHLILGSYSPQL